MVLRRVKVLVGCLALALGLVGWGLPGEARAVSLLVDDFSTVGTPPGATTNAWNQGPIAGVLGGSREQTKSGSGTASTRAWSVGPGTVSMTTTNTATNNVWNLVYDGTSNGSLTNKINPPIDISAFTSLDLDVTQSSATPGSVLLTLVTQNPLSPASSWTSTQTINLPSGPGTVSFDLLSGMTGLFNPYSLQRIALKFQNFG